LRLLLDEMYPPAIAHQLRQRGHDVTALTERNELRSISDDEVFAVAQDEHRAVATENIADFTVIANRADDRGLAHYGLVLIDPVKFRRGQKRTVGRFLKELDRLIVDQAIDQASSGRFWL
jgi:hypothetical protein